MGSLKPLQFCLCLMVAHLLQSAESMLLVRFDRAPPHRTRFSTAVFRYSTLRPDGSNPCEKHQECSFSCKVMVIGSAHIDASTLRAVKPSIKYSLILAFSTESAYERVAIKMADDFCTDEAGNRLTKTNGSILVVHYDRRPVLVDIWTSVPSYELEIDKVMRTVYAANKLEDLEIFLDFSDRVNNSTEEILSVLSANAGTFAPIHTQSHRNRQFTFKEHSRAQYWLTIMGESHKVSAFVRGSKVKDVAGNLNLASNTLEVRQYSPPAISAALNSFVTAGFLATSLAAAAISLSSANLGAIGNGWASTSVCSIKLDLSKPANRIFRDDQRPNLAYSS
ncbi:hypothetical protein Sjap_016502 [Stephania japonica]|uniref:Uncharacterized protein n=1 Tax=Stephania japonica TaxID=461633 RepID=A0AAP0IM22_9MAGN